MNPSRHPPTDPLRVSIAGTGSHVPERILTNEDLAGMVDTTDEWILTRTGMRERRIAADHEASSDLGTEAARRALADAGAEADEVDLLIVSTVTPDFPLPNTACVVQQRIGASRAACMSLEAACSGFVYALEVGRHFIAGGAARTVLVIGAEKLSSITDWQDRSTCVLFGDGAAAAVIRRSGSGRGILATVLGADGSLGSLLQVPAGGSRLPASERTVRERLHTIKMNGREVFKHAVTKMTRAARSALSRAGLAARDIRWVVPHQANIRIIQAISERMNIPMDRFVVNVEKYGNTSCASVGIALDEAARDGRIRPGDRVLLLVFGAGFTWGAMIVEWGR